MQRTWHCSQRPKAAACNASVVALILRTEQLGLHAGRVYGEFTGAPAHQGYYGRGMKQNQDRGVENKRMVAA